MMIKGIHHAAYKCKDPEETRAFYEDLLGLPLFLTVQGSGVPTTGGPSISYFHFFFEMENGSSIAFFDLSDGEMPLPSPNIPAWVNHLALEVDSEKSLRNAHQRLTNAGVDVVGPIDYKNFVRSIYFFDPNGIRLELTTPIGDGSLVDNGRDTAHDEFKQWIDNQKN